MGEGTGGAVPKTALCRPKALHGISIAALGRSSRRIFVLAWCPLADMVSIPRITPRTVEQMVGHDSPTLWRTRGLTTAFSCCVVGACAHGTLFGSPATPAVGARTAVAARLPSQLAVILKRTLRGVAPIDIMGKQQ